LYTLIDFVGKGEIKIKIAIIGGDKREEIMIQCLADKGYKLSVLTENQIEHPNVTCYTAVDKVVSNQRVVIAPMSGTDQNGILKSTFIRNKVQLTKEFFRLLTKDTLFLIGIAKPAVKKILEDELIQYIEMACLDDLAIMNAIPTAEGAIKIAIEESGQTIFGSNILTYGLGKVGLSIAWRLKALGAESYAVTRNKAAMARGKDLGIKMLTYNQLEEYLSVMEIIYNTVPKKIITANSISLMQKKTLMIDLASAPGGIDFEAADQMGIKTIQALGLPGKVAPITAGKILAEIIPSIINR